MSERDQQKPSSQPGRVLRCDEWEGLIADALDGTLPPADAAAFARHHGECALCAQMLKEAQQGRSWLEYLAVEPEIPQDLLKKILARTSGMPDEATGRGIAAAAQAMPAHLPWQPRRLPAALHGARQFARHAVEPRLMMTVAMAFFSVALTLNLTGIRLTQMRPGDLQPARLRATLTRQYYATNEQVTKYYLNLRLVYEMEARVRELRRSTEAEPAALQTPRPSPGSAPAGDAPRQPLRDGTGSPSSTVPRGEMPAPAGRGSDFQNDALLPVGFVSAPKKRRIRNEVFRALRSTTEDQAKRSLV